MEPEEVGAGATGGREGVEGVVITGHEDRFVRFFDANSGEELTELQTRFKYIH
jgi:striatin 1/3/4